MDNAKSNIDSNIINGLKSGYSINHIKSGLINRHNILSGILISSIGNEIVCGSKVIRTGKVVYDNPTKLYISIGNEDLEILENAAALQVRDRTMAKILRHLRSRIVDLSWLEKNLYIGFKYGVAKSTVFALRAKLKS